MIAPRVPLMVDLAELRERMRYLDPVATCAYLALLDHHWSHGALPSQDHALAAACRLEIRTFRRVKEQLSTLFDLDAHGRWHDRTFDRNRSETLEKSERKSRAGRANAQVRWAKSRHEPETPDRAAPGADRPNANGTSPLNVASKAVPGALR